MKTPASSPPTLPHVHSNIHRTEKQRRRGERGGEEEQKEEERREAARAGGCQHVSGKLPHSLNIAEVGREPPQASS
jgi:general stress protein YciG